MLCKHADHVAGTFRIDKGTILPLRLRIAEPHISEHVQLKVC